MLVFLLGLSLVTSTVVSAMCTFVPPHSAPNLLSRAKFDTACVELARNDVLLKAN